MQPVRLVARSMRGIEHLVAEEINELGGVLDHVRHREVWFRAAEPPRLLCADDIFLVAGVIDGVGRHRSALDRLAREAERVDVRALLRRRCVAEVAPSGMDVCASFLGRRNYTRYDVEDALGEVLAGLSSLPYHSRRGGLPPPYGCASWRVTIEGDRAMLGLRLGPRPLHRRPYKRGSVRGTLHPPLAAAMARLAGVAGVVVDPCCGAGTLLIEAAAQASGARLLGFDRDASAVRTARSNDQTPAWAVTDAGRIPLPDRSVDRVLVNPPWGRQVPAQGLIRDRSRLWRELRRVLNRSGRVVALVHDPGSDLHLAAESGLRPQRRLPVSLSGRHPEIAVLSIQGE